MSAPASHTNSHPQTSPRTTYVFGKTSSADDVTSGVSLSGKTVLLTGSNSGIGLESLRVLTKQGAHVIAVARSFDDAQRACSLMQGETTPIGCDLGDLFSVAQAIKAVSALGRPIDRFIANAGIMAPPKLTLRHGIESQFMVNHIGHFMLTVGLLDAICAAKHSRIIITSSRMHKTTPKGGIRLENLSGEHGYHAWQFYGQSKLANILFANELARRLAAHSHTTVNSLHPGLITDTGLNRSLDLPSRIIVKLIATFSSTKSIQQGAATQCFLAARPEVEGVSGAYFEDCRPQVASAHAQDLQLAARLWQTSVRIIAQVTGLTIDLAPERSVAPSSIIGSQHDGKMLA